MKLVIFAVIMIFCDVLTGLFKGGYNGNINSTYLRKGMMHKLSEIMAIAVCWIIDFSLAYSGINIDLKIAGALCIYISIMELISVLENLGEVNPKLKKFLQPYLEKLRGETEDDRN